MEVKIFDGDNNLLNEGDRVFAFDMDGSRVYGKLITNDYKEVSDWAVEYDDGETCAVLDLKQIWKA